jgi:uncharacterized metal-binding protein YceD (DUF177 family)
MRPEVNLRHLEDDSVSLEGELALEELDVGIEDSLVHLKEPLFYELDVQKMEEGLLVQGTLRLTLDCECARCLKSFRHKLIFEGWTAHIPLQGEEKAAIVNDVVDLTPYVREDIVLAFPQRPLCGPDCKGLPGTDASQKSPLTSNPWAELNKLKLK